MHYVNDTIENNIKTNNYITINYHYVTLPLHYRYNGKGSNAAIKNDILHFDFIVQNTSMVLMNAILKQTAALP